MNRRIMLLLTMAICGVVHAAFTTTQLVSSVSSPFITAYTMTRSRVAELGLLGRLWDGHTMNNIRGDIGESIAERAFFGGPEMAHSKKGSWVSVSPRDARQGIDHIFLLVDKKNGLPRSIILAESKYGSSQLGMSNYGKQMGASWIINNLTKIVDKYYDFAQSSDPIVRVESIPTGAKGMDVYFSKTQRVTIWKSGNRWYATDAKGITDKQLRVRAYSYGKYFEYVGNERAGTRNFLFRIEEQKSGDSFVYISKLTDEAEIINTRTEVVPREFSEKGRVNIKILKETLKGKFSYLTERQLTEEAEALQRVISNRELVNAGSAPEWAIKELRRSSMVSAGFAGTLSLASQLGTEFFEHGTDIKSYDFGKIAISTAKESVVVGGASYAGQRTSLFLSGNTIKKYISSGIARRIGGGVGAMIIAAESLGGCITGRKSWRDGAIEAGIGATSMAAGSITATGVSALLTSGTTVAASTAAAGAGVSGTAVVATGAASVGTTGAAGVGAVGTAGAGAVGGSGGFAALATVAGPVIAAVAVGAAISYGGYFVYDHYRAIECMNGEFFVNEQKLDKFFSDPSRYEKSINRVLGF